MVSHQIFQVVALLPTLPRPPVFRSFDEYAQSETAISRHRV